MQAWQLEWIGYIASAIIALSLLITNVWYFRWINLVGASLFSMYGLMIGALPVAFMNGFIAVIDIFFIVRMTKRIDFFHYVTVTYKDSAFLRYFLRYYTRDIEFHFPHFSEDNLSPDQKYIFIVRNAMPVGVFTYHQKEDCAVIDLDYSIPAFRDLKNTRYLIRDALTEEFAAQGIKRLSTYSTVSKHIRYIKKLGFTEDLKQSNLFHLDLPMP